jgi:dipeptidyl aminopeptidase/acylaminoacyl peptidase
MPMGRNTRLGPYEIVAPLGAGGMGEVYRAHDTRLGRDVAIKVLSSRLAATPDARARFEREARAISRLNNPHICTLHDIGHQDGTDYLVMELLEGETLAHRLKKGPLPVAEVLTLGTEMAEALDVAHRHAVVHRDLKPGNIMLTKSGAKLMDFGLARVHAQVPLAAPPADSPTVSRPLTAEGTIVGTFRYLAPEQLEGHEADARSDVWALGCVLYEMATGKRAFEGDSQAALISAIMKDEPRPITEVQPLSPPALGHVVTRCLAKDPAERWQSARDVVHELEWVRTAGSQAAIPTPVPARRRHSVWPTWTLAAVALISAASLGWVVLASRTPKPDVVQAVVDPPLGAELTRYRGHVTISPDGQAVAFAADDTAGIPWLWIRPLGSITARQIPGTEQAWLPFWSPDGRFIAFFDNQEGTLKKVSVAGGSPTVICTAPGGRGGTWSRDGVVVFAPTTGPLMRVASAGGEPMAVTTLDSTRNETGHRFPCFLPDGRHFLFAALAARPDVSDICVGDLGSVEVKHILTSSSGAVFAEPGYLIFERDLQMMAQRFDSSRLEVEGEAVAIAGAPLGSEMGAEPVASASRNGRLALLRSMPSDARLTLLDRTGAICTRYELPPSPWKVLSAAPGGKRALAASEGDLWIVDLSRSVPMRFASNSTGAVWSPGGDRVAYVAPHAGRNEISVVGLDGQGGLVPTTDDVFKSVNDWSPDGRYLVFTTQCSATNHDLWLLPLEGERKPVSYLRSSTSEADARVSPDGRWLAYFSNETGRAEVYVQSFPRPGRKVRVSPDGGDLPMWAKRGRELIYSGVGPPKTIMSVPVEAGEEFRPGPPLPLFALPAGVTGLDVVADGERFLASMATEARPRDIQIILNWQALLKQ